MTQQTVRDLLEQDPMEHGHIYERSPQSGTAKMLVSCAKANLDSPVTEFIRDIYHDDISEGYARKILKLTRPSDANQQQ